MSVSKGSGGRGGQGKGHILVTANSAWNLLNFRKSLISALMQDGNRVTVLAPHDDAVEGLLSLGCRYIPLRMDNTGLSPLADLGLTLRFLRTMIRERPDAVLGFTIKNNIYGALAARFAGIPFLPNVSGLGTGFLSGAALQAVVTRLYRFAFARVPVVFFQNEDDRRLFTEAELVPAANTRCLPGSGVDLAHFASARPRDGANETTFLLIARLLWDKGIGEFVEAARLVRRRHPEVRFQLLGSLGAANRTAIDQATVNGWIAEGVVTYLGETNDVRPFIAAADCVVLPSYREGRPRSLIEAAAMARPCIATDVPGCRDVVEHGRTGFLCKLKDPQDLARKMEAFLALSADARSELGRNGRLKTEREYDEALVIQAYRRELHTLANNATLGRGEQPVADRQQVARAATEA